MTSSSRALLFVVAIAFCFMATGAASASAQKRSTALVAYGTAADEIEPGVRAALGALRSVALKDKAATQADVAAAAELGTSCSAEAVECLASLAVLLRVDVLVVAIGQRRQEGVALELFSIDAALGKESARESAQLSDVGGPATRAALREVVELLLEPHLHFGSIVVAAPPSSSVRIDGVPAEPDYKVRARAGQHRVEVSLPGHEPFAEDVDVAAGVDVVVAATLAPLAPLAPLAAEPPAATDAGGISGAWIIAGSGAAIAVVGAGIALGIDAGLGASLGSAEEKEGYQALGVTALVVASAGAAVALTAAVIALAAD